MGDVADQIAYFQAITGVDDPDLCTEILSAHNWDLDLAISSFTSTSAHARSPDDHPQPPQRELGLVAPPGIAWRLITLPFSIVAASFGIVSGAVGFASGLQVG